MDSRVRTESLDFFLFIYEKQRMSFELLHSVGFMLLLMTGHQSQKFSSFQQTSFIRMYADNFAINTQGVIAWDEMQSGCK